MSTLDRAFFRAYAKDQPSVQALPAEERLPADAAFPANAALPAASAASESPYVHFITSRQSELRYRIDRTHAPWLHAAPSSAVVAPAARDTNSPTVDAPSAPPEDDDYRLAASFDVPAETTVWPQVGRRSNTVLPTPAVTTPTAVPLPIAAGERTTTPSTFDPFAQGIVCLPGMSVPESNYLAALLAAELSISETGESNRAHSSAQATERLSRLDQTEIAQISGRHVVDESSTVRRPATTAVEELATTAVNNHDAAVSSSPSTAEEQPITTAEPVAAFWEVDQYLYPEISDRLLGEYDYFSQAGAKLKLAANAGLKVLGVTGVGRDEGRSTLVLCLARAAAQAGLKVAMIDSDFARPQLAQQIGLDVAAGWESVMQGKLPLAEVAIRSLADGITLLPLTEAAIGCSLSLSDAAVSVVLEQAKATHDVLILDLGPLGASAKLDWSASPLDAAIVVWDRRHRKLQEAQAVARVLSAAGVEAVGIAENFAEIVL